MADFTLSQVEGVAASPNPRSGVQEPSLVETAAEFGSGLLSIFAQGAPQRAAQQKQERESMEQTVVGRFQQQQMQIANAVDTGDLTSQEARMRMRANLSAAISDNGVFSEALSQAHAQVLSTAGMGKVAAEGTEREQQFFAIQAEAAKVGMVLPGMSEEEARRGTMDFIALSQARLENELAREQLALSKAQADEQKAWVTLGTSRINQERASLELDMARAEQKQESSLETQVSAFLPSFGRTTQRLVAEVEAGALAPDQAEVELRTELDKVFNEIDTQGVGLDANLLSTHRAPFQRLFDTARGVISGEFSTDMLTDLTNNIKAQDVLLFMQSPSARATAAVSEVYGPAASAVIQLHGRTAAGEAMTSFIQGLKDSEGEGGARRPFDIFNSSPEGRRAYADAIRNTLESVNKGTPTPNPEQRSNETLNLVNNTLRSLGRFGDDLEFEEYKPLLETIASDEYGGYITGEGATGISAQDEGRVKEFMEAFFNDQIRPLVEEKWRTATVASPGARPGPSDEVNAPDAIRPVFAGDTVTFIKTESAPNTPAMDRAVRELNDKVSPALRMFIRTGAHLEKSTDYQGIFQRDFSGIFEGERIEVDGESDE